ncbi:hypothetical protein OIDMADRAFT_18064 [Oidiodendron maius Zn]|uniref:Uncharacterized protein n=1 Tax=Oidiodendron maius (strain Zn) TaxID=913774 RepID=A0A0C3HLF3_OIDMZ|nr:hypothetical protein OIDMADRAFT_18064 [Oidiodendron maius Zn]
MGVSRYAEERGEGSRSNEGQGTGRRLVGRSSTLTSHRIPQCAKNRLIWRTDLPTYVDISDSCSLTPAHMFDIVRSYDQI